MSLQQQPLPPPTASLHSGRGAIGPVIAVLAVIAVVGIVTGVVGRLCSGGRIVGLRQYDVNGWIEWKFASCIDGRIEQPAAADDQRRISGDGGGGGGGGGGSASGVNEPLERTQP